MWWHDSGRDSLLRADERLARKIPALANPTDDVRPTTGGQRLPGNWSRRDLQLLAADIRPQK